MAGVRELGPSLVPRLEPNGRSESAPFSTPAWWLLTLVLGLAWTCRRPPASVAA